MPAEGDCKWIEHRDLFPFIVFLCTDRSFFEKIVKKSGFFLIFERKRGLKPGGCARIRLQKRGLHALFQPTRARRGAKKAEKACFW